jgi:glycolate oxidase FAD binding subunit
MSIMANCHFPNSTDSDEPVTSRDDSAALIARVQQAVAARQPLRIAGGNSKQHIGNPLAVDSELLSTGSHSGVISYEPTELVVSVRGGTSMAELHSVLSDAGQMLPFEPPSPAGSTIGGVLACGLSGPRRPFAGAARDYVLGTRVINGRGQDLSFGGEVMKNVAGYDVSRLQVGAWGTLGVLLDVSMKVLPLPEAELTLVHEVADQDTRAFSALLRQPLPLSGAMQIGRQRYLRLSGSESAVRAAAQQLGGDTAAATAQLWQSVRDHRHEFFTQRPAGRTLWRISVADHAPALSLSGDWLFEWAGAQRWLMTDLPAVNIFDAAKAVGGHATRYAEGSATEPAFQPLEGPMQRLQMRVRDSFDPQRLFNRGRFHPELDKSSAADQPAAVSA